MNKLNKLIDSCILKYHTQKNMFNIKKNDYSKYSMSSPTRIINNCTYALDGSAFLFWSIILVSYKYQRKISSFYRVILNKFNEFLL